MRTRLSFVFILILLVQLSGCAGKAPSPLPSENGAGGTTTAQVKRDIRDPAGPIPAPSLPAQMNASSAPAAKAPPASSSGKHSLTYTVECSVRFAADGNAPDKDGSAAENSAPASAITGAFEKNSLLYKMIDTPPDSLTGLEQRLSVSLKEGREILNSQGYYAGKINGFLKPADKDKKDAPGIVVRVIFSPGPRYTLGRTRVKENRQSPPPAYASKSGPARGEEGSRRAPAPPPRTLADVNLPEGAPAVAADVLAAVDRVLDVYHDNGYPFASLDSTRYVVDHERQKLEAEVLVSPGEFVRMGAVERHGAPTVKTGYVEAMRTWKTGRPWSRSKVESFQDALRQSGLFQSIEVKPAQTADAEGVRAVVTTLEGAPERTIGGALKYNSDFGPGIQAYWEHRNLTGRGDRLRLEAPVWQDMQELTASYRLPFFLRDDQHFIANAGMLHQDIDAYSLQSAAASAGLERRFSRRWSGSAQVRAETGSLKEPDKPQREYAMLGLPLSATYDSTQNLLDATKGSRLIASLAPYTGEFDGDFSVLRSRLDGHTFFSLADEDRLVLALRGTLGAVAGASAQQIPPSVRFYSGGGGSVRGYAYQSLGPRDSDDKPLGGNALAETSAEMRWKITPEWGLVGFVDGGTAVDEPLKNPNLDMRWGAGVGVRYYTAIGPVRLDLATPLNPRDDDDPLQFYISIGQSF